MEYYRPPFCKDERISQSVRGLFWHVWLLNERGTPDLFISPKTRLNIKSQSVFESAKQNIFCLQTYPKPTNYLTNR